MPLEHVILDLDNTIICSIYTIEELDDEKKTQISGMRKEVMEDYYDIYERPGLQEFLDYLFTNYKVSVFTAASKDYALYIIDKFILTKPERVLDYIFWSYHCTISKNKYKGNNKRIAMLIEDFDLGDSYKIESTVLIDDLSDWAKDQKEQVITIPAFDIEKDDCQNDNVLKDIQNQLEERRLS